MYKLSLTAILTLALILVSCSGRSAAPEPAIAGADSSTALVLPAASTVHVEIAGFAYKPQTITVSPGARVVWTNRDTARHSVSDIKETWDSGLFREGGAYERVFNQKGDYEYYCTLHPAMTGKVVVK
ncbi:MAG: cupredoxin family copper-binding protein [Chloroflexi bacterium]|nr:cupredoxin family copper-binding protein [Chloroflexota bacterium]